MGMNRISLWIMMGVVSAVAAVPARAEFYRDVARAMSLFDYRFSGERNLLGDGFTVNANAFYNNRRFNFGFADLTLNGAVLLSADITKRGLPAFQFRANTGGGANPLSYEFNLNNGIQDLTATGSILVNMDTRINSLGFYDQTLQISNRGTFETDGFGVVDAGTLDFDVGPIDIHGNVFADALAALTEPFFAATGAENPFAKFSGKATKAAEANRKAEELRARIDSGEVLSDDEIAALVNNTVLAAVLGAEPDSRLFSGLLIPPDLLEKTAGDKSTRSITITDLPEPGGLALLAAGLPLLRRRRPKVLA